MVELIEKTIGELLAERVKEVGGREAIVYHHEGVRYTYGEFYEATTRIAKGLMALGIKKGENIAVWASNVPEWILLQFASARMGAVLVTVNTNYRKQELTYLLKQSESTTLFYIDHFKDVSYREIAESIGESGEIPTLERLIYIGEKEDGLTFDHLYQLGEDVTDEELADRESSLKPEDVINMQYTSGTTGFPKGVMLTHRNIVNNANQVATAMDLVKGDKLCIPVPFFHCFGCVMSTMACVCKGAVMVPVAVFSPLKVLETVEAEQCTALHGVPTMFIAELNHPDFEKFDLSSLRKGIMAGSTCPVEVMKRVIQDMGMEDITIAYGQTESSPVITQTRIDDTLERKVETVGRPLPLVEAKIVDPETGEELASGQQGELCTRGYHVMLGYYNNPAATKEAIDTEGWLHTGDLAIEDEEGYYTITGRLKDMIIRGGENIYPREIEECLYTHPSVRDVQVVGIPDDDYGEVVAAFLQTNEKIESGDIRRYCRERLADYKVPVHIFFSEEFPMTASGKIQKFKLREQAEQFLSKS